MKPVILIRIGSILILIHAILHTIGHLSWKTPANAAYNEVIKQMTGPKFLVMGASRSMGEFFDGYGFFVTLALLLVAWFLWMASNLIENNPGIATRMLLPLTVFLFGLGIVEIIFFFPFAAGISLLAAILSLIAMFQLMQAD